MDESSLLSRRTRGKLVEFVVERVFGINDEPKRIAWGVFWGLFIGCSPTMGVQILLYLALSSLLRFNRVAGIPFLFVSNPFTAIPLYYSAWFLGALVLGSRPHGPEPDGPLKGFDVFAFDSYSLLARQMGEEAFWQNAMETFLAIGGELWVGALIFGTISGAFGFLLTYRGVMWYRNQLRPTDSHSSPPRGLLP